MKTDNQNIIWTMPYAGVNLNPKTYFLTFEISHIGAEGGVKAVNQSVIYEDGAGNQLNFPSPSVEISCPEGPSIQSRARSPRYLPYPTARTQSGQYSGTLPCSLGRMVQLDVTLRAVCPWKRVTVSVILSEVDPQEISVPRGVKHILPPAQNGAGCQDITLRCIQFSVPEALDTTGNKNSICNPRTFRAQVLAIISIPTIAAAMAVSENPRND